MTKIIRKFIIFFSVFFLIRPAGLEYLAPRFSTLYEYGLVLSSVICVFSLLVEVIIRKKVSATFVVFVIYMIYMFINTLVKDGPIINCMNVWGTSFVSLCLYESFRKDYIAILRACEIVLLFYSIVNLLMIVQYPYGMYIMEGTNYTDCWILGYKSSFQYYFVPLLLAVTLFYQYFGEKILFISTLAIVHASSILAGNAMLIIVLFIFDIIFFFKIHERRGFGVKIVSIAVVSTNLLFVFFSELIGKIRPLNYLLYSLLGKTNTLLIRINSWNKCFKYILSSPIFGYGHTTGREMKSYFGINIVHIHNQFLSVMLQGGGIGLILFVTILVIVCKHLSENSDIESSKITLLVLFIFLISLVVEVFYTGQACLVWPLFLLAGDTKELHMQLIKRKKQ